MRPSPLAEAVARVGDRWALLLVHALLDGPRRFNDLLDDTGIAPNVLTTRLRHLEQNGVVVASPYSKRPPRFVYQLTAAGQELAGALRLLAQWGAGRTGDDAEPLRHQPCGTPMEARWYCPSCASVVDEGADEIRFL
ncbi:MAG: helix-turn-helix transcriptional regulator [Actinomycetota bacterium]|nr:helix-turn-helix transcriptional regulator [Actinomycetota bacterium]